MPASSSTSTSRAVNGSRAALGSPEPVSSSSRVRVSDLMPEPACSSAAALPLTACYVLNHALLFRRHLGTRGNRLLYIRRMHRPILGSRQAAGAVHHGGFQRAHFLGCEPWLTPNVERYHFRLEFQSRHGPL